VQNIDFRQIESSEVEMTNDVGNHWARWGSPKWSWPTSFYRAFKRFR